MMRTHKTIAQVGARAGVMATRSGRSATVLRQSPLHAASISTWERVRSSMWHPMTTVEHSLMDMKRLTSQLLSDHRRGVFPHSLIPRMSIDEDDFFRDINVRKSGATAKTDDASERKRSDDDKKHESQQHAKEDAKQSDDSDSGSTYASYSFSSSTVFDADGHRISTMRRRYEDSSGRLKAIHEREIDGKKLKSVWRRDHPDDDGEHHTSCLGSSSEEFEEQWKQTPFGQAEREQQKQKGQKELKSSDSDAEHEQAGGGKHEKRSDSNVEHEQAGGDKHEPMLEKSTDEGPQTKSAFGADYGASDVAPDKERGDAAHGVTDEAHAISREDAIAQGSKTQEEETTPPKYSS